MIFKIMFAIIGITICMLSGLSIIAEARANNLAHKKIKEMEEKIKMIEISANLNASLIRNYIDIQEKRNKKD